MRLIASDLYTYWQTSECPKRVYLRHLGETEAEPGPFEQVIFRLGDQHEKKHLKTLPDVIDLSPKSRKTRETETIEAVKGQAPVIYQPAFRVSVNLDGTDCEILGDPDFLIFDSSGYVIRDSKLARRITEKDHPEILEQVNLYGYLYEKTFGKPPKRLEVHGGTGEILEIPYDGGAAALKTLSIVLSLKQAESEPYTPVGWTKCSGCGFRQRCLGIAEQTRDIALVQEVDQGLALALHDEEIHSIDELLAAYTEDALSELQRPWGARLQRVGKKAGSILRNARCMGDKKEIVLQTPSIPESLNYVMFDLEGLPPFFDELDKIYLWGMQVFGEIPSDFIAATAGFGEEGDREGWENFLQKANEIFTEYGDIPFVHWAHYEKTKIHNYIERYGDPDGVAERVLKNHLDLLPITRNSIVLPLPSNSLKVVEEYVDYERKLVEYGGDWAMAKYIEAIETEDESERNAVMGQILDYNQEDLEATWAVFEWLRSKC